MEPSVLQIFIFSGVPRWGCGQATRLRFSQELTYPVGLRNHHTQPLSSLFHFLPAAVLARLLHVIRWAAFLGWNGLASGCAFQFYANGGALLSGWETPSPLVPVLGYRRPCDHRALGAASLALVTPPFCMMTARGTRVVPPGFS